jgi:hypothetical protein
LAVVELIVLCTPSSGFVTCIAIVKATSLRAISVARLRRAVWLSRACGVPIGQFVGDEEE